MSKHIIKQMAMNYVRKRDETDSGFTAVAAGVVIIRVFRDVL